MTRGPARAIIAPHAGYSYSGPTAAWAYKHVDPRGIRRVFLFGPSHHVYSPRCSLTVLNEYSTPFGPIQIDVTMNNTLRQTGFFDDMSRRTDEDEHSLEMHLPYIYHVMRGHDFQLVPVLVGALSEASELQYGQLFGPVRTSPNECWAKVELATSSLACACPRPIKAQPCSPHVNVRESAPQTPLPLACCSILLTLKTYSLSHPTFAIGESDFVLLRSVIRVRTFTSRSSSSTGHWLPMPIL